MPTYKRNQRIKAKASHCFYCERNFDQKFTGIKTLDHIIPISWGGTNSPNNLVPCCRWCNEQKADKTLVYFWEHIENLKKELRPNGGFSSHINLEIIQGNINKLQQRLFEESDSIKKAEFDLTLAKKIISPNPKVKSLKEIVKEIREKTTLGKINNDSFEEWKEKLLQEPEPDFHY